MLSIDLSGAYLQVPIHSAYEKYFFFMIHHQHFQFHSLPFGLYTIPKIFKKVLQTVIALLKERDLRIHHYQDNFLLFVNRCKTLV